MMPNVAAGMNSSTASYRQRVSWRPGHPRPQVRKIMTHANAPLEGPAVPVTREDLIAHIRSGCKPKDRWRIGTEHEKLGFRLADKRRMDYDEVRLVFEKLGSRFGWQPIKEGDLTIGVALDGQTVTLEPGGQFELSGAPLATLHQTCAEVNSHLYQVRGYQAPDQALTQPCTMFGSSVVGSA